MIKKKILLLSTYPIVGDTLTGGPLRVKAIYDAYRGCFSQVRHVAIFSKYHHPTDYASTDIAVTGALAEATRFAPNTGDYLIGQGIKTDPVLHDTVLKLLLDYRPDVIEIEQVYPYLGLRAVLEELPFKPKLVHSSHNVEYPMKEEIMNALGYAKSEVLPIVAAIREAEEELCAQADVVVAPTVEDGKLMQKMGAKDYVLARNGIAPLQANEVDKQYWRDYFASRNISKFALFVASAHPPNMLGFREMISTGVGFLPAGYAVVLAGDVGTNIMQNLQRDSIADVTCHRRLLSVGRLTVDRLHGIIACADVMLLPITEGGGSNLKTAEAVLSQHQVVATRKALRSFDEYADLPTVRVVDNPDDFRAAIRVAMDEKTPQLTKKQVQFTQELLWENCLQPMVEAVARL